MGLFARFSRSTQAADQAAVPPVRNRRARPREPEQPQDSADYALRRARRRLVGAVFLVTIAVIVLPLVLDKPAPLIGENIPIKVANQDYPEGAPGLKNKASTPRLANNPASNVIPSATLVSPKLLTPNPASQAVTSASAVGAIAAVTTPPKLPPKPEYTSENHKAAKSDSAKVEIKQSASKVEPSKLDPSKSELNKADAVKAKPAINTEPATYIVQLGAFSSRDKANEMRERAKVSGLKIYTEHLSTPQGERTRVRAGPFNSRQAADSAHDLLKALGLDATVMPG